jgi:hypothetical protein
VGKDDLPKESMKTDKALEFDFNKEISDNVEVDSEVQKSGRQNRKPACVVDYKHVKQISWFYFGLFMSVGCGR